jgi:hypothetical protein
MVFLLETENPSEGWKLGHVYVLQMNGQLVRKRKATCRRFVKHMQQAEMGIVT